MNFITINKMQKFCFSVHFVSLIAAYETESINVIASYV